MSSFAFGPFSAISPDGVEVDVIGISINHIGPRFVALANKPDGTIAPVLLSHVTDMERDPAEEEAPADV